MLTKITLLRFISHGHYGNGLRSDIGYDIDKNGSKVYVNIGPVETKRLIPNDFIPKIDVTIDNVTLKGITNSSNGGGMFLNNVGWNIPSLLMNNTVIDNCATGISGGAGYIKDILFNKIINSKFSGNKAVSGYGGTFHFENSTNIEFENVTINASVSYYAAISIQKAENFVAKDSTIANCSGTGYSVLVFTNTNNFEIQRCLIDKCSTSSSYGSIFVNSVSQKGIVENCVFSFNTGVQGGAILINSISEFYCNRCLFFFCTAPTAGAIYASGTTKYTCKESCFFRCQASSSYHAYYLTLSAASTVSLNYSAIIECGITNTGSYSAYINQGTIEIPLSNFSSSQASSYSCLRLTTSNIGFLQYSTIFNHSSTNSPVLLIQASSYPIIIQYCNVLKNNAGSSTIFQFSASTTTIQVLFCIFSLNSCAQIFSASGPTLVSNSFINHSTTVFSGSVSFQNTVMGITETYALKHVSTFGCEAAIPYQALEIPCQTQPNPPSTCICPSDVQASTLSQFSSILQLVISSLSSLE